MIAFSVLGHPTGKGRHRAAMRGGRVAMYTPKKTEEAERSFLAQALPHKPAQPLDVPLTVTFFFIVPIPKSWSKAKQAQALRGGIFPTNRCDIDNLAKLALDSMNGVFYLDDKQVVSLAAMKLYGDVPRTDVRIEAINGGNTNETDQS